MKRSQKMKTILLLGAGLEQSLAIREAKRLNYHVIACDQDTNAPGFKFSDVYKVLDITNLDSVFEVAEMYNVDGIFSHAVEIPHIVAEAARKLNLPGLHPKIAWRATNKIDRITHLSENGIPCAAFEIVENKGELEKKAAKINYPFVLKPIDTAGSRGVQLVKHNDNLQKAYKEAINYSKESRVLLEEVLQGPEVSTESVIYMGNVYTFAFADRNYVNAEKFRPFFIEDGINFPTKLPSKLQLDIHRLVEETIKVLGIDFGAAKGDVIIDDGVPKIIEMASRTSGGWFGAGSISAATGANMLKPLLQMSVGDIPDLEAIKPTHEFGCAQRYIIPTQKGVVASINGVEEASKSAGVIISEFFLPKVGETIRPATNHADRFGQIICTANTRNAAIELCETAISKIEIKIKQPK